MPKETIPFSAFVEAAGDEHTAFVNSMHEYMLENDCKVEIKEAANGYVVSYKHIPSKRTVLNYVFRKAGLMMRIYADNVSAYMEKLADWPEAMKSTAKKAGDCTRMFDPTACNSRCIGGFDFVIDGERQQKCRYSGFMFYLNDESKPHLREMTECEMRVRGL